MELFQNAKTVRLKSYHDKYLMADDDQESVLQDRQGTSWRAQWTVELVDSTVTHLRLKSCFGNYLTASEEQNHLGVTGRKVTLTLTHKPNSQVEWEPIRQGSQVKLKTRYGNYLRANGGLPPWRNSITHDIPHRHMDWILWAVDIIEIRPDQPPEPSDTSISTPDSTSPSFHFKSPKFSKLEASGSFRGSPTKNEGRMIYYSVVDDDVEGEEEISFQFKGHNLEDLTIKLEEETGLEDIIVCSRNKINGQLYPLRLSLPPNNVTMHVVVIPSSSEVARAM